MFDPYSGGSQLTEMRQTFTTMARVLRLQFIEGKSQEEIAAIEESTVPAVKTRVHRAKKLFKQSYDQNR